MLYVPLVIFHERLHLNSRCTDNGPRLVTPSVAAYAILVDRPADVSEAKVFLGFK